MRTVNGYKLLRVRKDGTLGPLFIHRKQVIPVGEWLDAESHPTKGYAIRPGWHCTPQPEAPHLSMRLATGEKRVWCRVSLDGVERFERSEAQGGLWYLAKRMRVEEVLTEKLLP